MSNNGKQMLQGGLGAYVLQIWRVASDRTVLLLIVSWCLPSAVLVPYHLQARFGSLYQLPKYWK